MLSITDRSFLIKLRREAPCRHVTVPIVETNKGGVVNMWDPARLAALDLAGKTRVQEKMRVSVRQMQRAVGARGKNFRKRVRQG